MTKVLRVALVRPMPDQIHWFRNFGEEVYRALKDDTTISIDEIDRAVLEFYIRDIRSKFVRSAAAEVRKIALRDGMSDIITVDEIVIPDA